MIALWIILGALVGWYIFTFVVVMIQTAYMYHMEKKCSYKKEGLERKETLSKSGRLIVSKDYKFTFFPNDTGKRSPLIIICPGGGYKYLCIEKEGWSTAARLNEYGLCACVMEYGTGKDCFNMSPMKELAAAIRHISENEDLYNVDSKNYILIGYSAGGNLAGMFGTKEEGYMKYGLHKPLAVFLGYFWTSDPEYYRHHCVNPWVWLLDYHLFARGNQIMFKKRRFSEWEKNALALHKKIDKDYPKAYLFSGTQDIVVPHRLQCGLVQKAVAENHVEHIYHVFKGMPHGVAVGDFTTASGWLPEALAFAGIDIEK